MDASLVTRILREITLKLSLRKILLKQTENSSFDVRNVLGGKETLKLLQAFHNTTLATISIDHQKVYTKKCKQVSTLNQYQFSNKHGNKRFKLRMEYKKRSSRSNYLQISLVGEICSTIQKEKDNCSTAAWGFFPMCPFLCSAF